MGLDLGWGIGFEDVGAEELGLFQDGLGSVLLFVTWVTVFAEGAASGSRMASA